ncbi:MAG: SUMF1/EgtB/PvdO family nonheme iron enzyme [Lysobacterales bacterium]
MLAFNNILKYSTQLILLSALLWVAHSQAQQETEEAGSTDNRRIERLGEVSTDEWEMDLSLPSEAAPVSPDIGAFVLPDEEQNQKLQTLLSRLAANPGNTGVLAQINALLADVLGQANSLMDAGSLDQAESLFPPIQSINPGLAGFSAAKRRLKTLREANELLKAGEDALLSGRLLEPTHASAMYFYSQVLEKDPQSVSAREGLERVQNALIERALELARELDFESAEIWLVKASTVREDQKPIEDARFEIAEFKRERAADLEKQVVDAIYSGDFEVADFRIIDLIALGGHEAQVKSLLAQLEEARIYGGFEAGQIISDELSAGGKTPEIVIIDAGSFLMGSQGRSDNVSDHEEPRHRVTIKRGFGLGVREVTVAEFQLFVASTGYRTTAELAGESSIYDEAAGRLSKRKGVYWKHDYKGKEARPGMPVLHVSAIDAEAYVEWLANETGKRYRLPSEAEYEYVARAGGSGTYWWGEESPAEPVENLTGERDKSTIKREWSTYFNKYGDGHWGPAPAGSLANDALVHPMGVQDIAGNVSEWMADCWHENYVQAPSDGSAWFNPGCARKVVRGGYWASAPEQSRAAYRFPVKAQSYGPVIGFRIARDL